MTHLIQFSVDMDDESIRNQIVKNTAVMVERVMFDGGRYVENDYYGARMSRSMKDIVELKVSEFLSNHSDEIIEACANRLSEKLSRTKKCKELLSNLDDSK